MGKRRVLVVAPHPDDETLGCGGSLLFFKEKGYELSWLIVTGVLEENGFSKSVVENRQKEIEQVTNSYGFQKVIELDIPTTQVDTIRYGNLVEKVSEAFIQIRPNILLIPFYGDVHTDHKLTVEACLSCTKWFRHPYIETVLSYETLSETDFNLNSSMKRFEPNVYIDISDYLDRKIEILDIYKSEVGKFPFPRSKEAVRSLANLRGSQCGSLAAEAFQLERTIVK